MRTARTAIIIILLLLTSFSLASALNNADVVHYYTFDSDATDSAGSVDGSVTSATNQGTNCVINNCYNFDGSNDYIDFTGVNALGTDFSVSFWIDYTWQSGDFVFTRAGTNPMPFYVQMTGSTGDMVFQVRNSADTAWETANFNVGTGLHHVVLVRDQTNTETVVYVDGVKGTANTNSFTTLSTSYNMRIGAHQGGSTGFLDGTVDEVAFFDVALTSSEISELYDSGSGVQYPFTGGFTHNITGLYLSPNGTVYTDESDLRGYVTLNTTTGVYGLNYTYMVNGADITSGQYTGSPSGSQYTLPVFSNSNFQQEDNVSFKAFAVNSTGSALSEERTSGIVTIQNRVPSATLSWSTNAPLNDTNFTGIVTPSDSDADTLNISWTLYKNGVVSSSGSSNNQASPYGSINLFTIDSATTNINDTYTFNVSIYDGYDYYISADSENATVTATANWTVVTTNALTGSGIENFTVLGSFLGSFLVSADNNNTYNLADYYFNDRIEVRVSGASFPYTVYLYDGSSYTSIDTLNTGVNLTVYMNGTEVNYYDSYTPTGMANPPTSYYYNAVSTGYSSVNSSTLITPLVSNSTDDVTVQSYFYYPRTYEGTEFNQTLYAELYPFYSAINYTFNGNISYNGSNYVRVLNITFTYICHSDGTSTLNLYEDGVSYGAYSVTCDNTTQEGTVTYTPTTEGSTTLSAYLNNTYESNDYDYQFFSTALVRDTTNPTITNLTYTGTEGFSWNDINVTAVCTDALSPYLTYNILFNGVEIENNNRSSGYEFSDSRTPNYGYNTLTFTCSDLFGSDTEVYNASVYRTTLNLIDELQNVAFDVTNLTSVKIYYDDNSTFYDLKNASVSSVNFTSLENNKLRAELVYSDGGRINRYIDVSLLSGDIRICANKEGITHYTQIIISNTEKAVLMESDFANCHVLADYTRFAYEDALSVKAYTINIPYEIYVNSNGATTLLAGFDGSQSSFINIDTLEFNERAYDIDLLTDSFNINKINGQEQLKIRYNNNRDEVEEGLLVITRLDTGATLLSTSSFDDPNTFTVTYDYSTQSNIQNNTLFKLTYTKTLSDGGEEVVTRYFDPSGSSGLLVGSVGFIAGLLITLFAFTFTVTRLSFSWFGILLYLVSLAVLGFTITTTAVTFLIGVNIILIVYSGFLMTSMYSQSVS